MSVEWVIGVFLFASPAQDHLELSNMRIIAPLPLSRCGICHTASTGKKDPISSGFLRLASPCHARAGGHPVTPVLSIQLSRWLLDRPVKPGDDKTEGARILFTSPLGE
ncbi:MAG: hypothetical protein ACREC3_11245, partial [Methyloceanibacter sp.]